MYAMGQMYPAVPLWCSGVCFHVERHLRYVCTVDDVPYVAAALPPLTKSDRRC